MFFHGRTALALSFVAYSTAALANLQYSPETTPEGLRFVVVSGEFEAKDDIVAFRRAVLAHEAVAVSFHSLGGEISKAIEIGRTIRVLGLDTFQIRSLDCASACAFAFLGGVRRAAEPGSIGVHRSWYPDGSLSADIAVSAVQELTADVMSYMREMGVDPTLVELSLRYDATDMRYLSGSEMARYRVTSTSLDEIASGPPPAPRETASREQQPPRQPELIPVDISGRKVGYPDIPGDTRPVGWVYINSCDGEPSPLAENLRTRLQRDLHSGAVRLLLAKVGYFNREIANCQIATHALVDFVQPQASKQFVDDAKWKLMAILYNYNVAEFKGTPGQNDDPYRFDIWLRPSATPPSLPSPTKPSLLELSDQTTDQQRLPRIPQAETEPALQPGAIDGFMRMLQGN